MPLFFLGYFIMPKRALKNGWLLLASLVFYAWGEPVYVALMIVSIIVNWLFALALGGKRRGRGLLLVAACTFNILVIGFFKYEGFLAGIVNSAAGTEIIPNLSLPLPIGISFYTLQALSYVIDVYRNEVEPQRNVFYLGMYIACFPQLIAGPIVRYQTIQDQVLNRRETLADFSSGLRLFIVGLGKKVLLANTVAILATHMLEMGGPQIGAVGAWGGLIAYTFQIFFDFSGYSDMAIGLGRMMGFKYLRNFNYPYISRSITEFWRRWHISLSTFFRDYIYVPLGGSRCSRGRWVFNIVVVWAVTGLWHSAAWNYVLWGVYYGALLIVEKLWLGRVLDRLPRIVGHVWCIAVFIFGWSFFWITDSSALVQYWQALGGAFGATGTSTFWQLGVWEYWPVFVICIVASTPIVPYLKHRIVAFLEGRRPEPFSEKGIVNAKAIQADTLCVFEPKVVGSRKGFARVITCAGDLALIAILVLAAISIVSGSFNPFIYFQF